MKCRVCGKEIENPTDHQKDIFRRKGYCYCSKDCSQIIMRKISSETMKKTNEKYKDSFSKRMIENNPMKKEEIREKVKTTLRLKQWKPTIRKGNGTGATKAQLLLASSLGWEMEFVVKTGHSQRAGSGYPTCYKIDIANEKLKIAIEVDGNSHHSLERQKQDEKKTEFLIGLGWKVLRFKNKEVLNELESCLEKIKSMI